MAYKDVREFLRKLDQSGELYRVKQKVDTLYEIGGWVRYSDDMRPKGPALLFENIDGYKRGYRLYTGGIGSRKRLAIALDVNPDIPLSDLILTYKKRIQRPIDPVTVTDGPVKENVKLYEQVDLSEFPIPWWTPKDGGRYVGTWHANVTKNKVTGITNIGMYRVQLVDQRRTCVGFLPYSDLGYHYKQRESSGEALEMAIVIGADETINMAAASGEPEHIDEYSIAGGLREEPVELVKCETVDLCVPANAEIVIEGRIVPGDRMPEGPFGEHTGYHGGGVRMRPVLQVSGIMHRNDPILRGSLLGKPTNEIHMFYQVGLAANGLKMFENHGPSGVKMINCPPEGDSILSAIIQISPYYVGHSWDVGRTWLSSSNHCKYVVIVDEDINPFDLGEVWWAIMTRTQGTRDIEILRWGKMSKSDPSIPRDQGEFSDKVIIDATKKLDYPYVEAWEGHWAPVCMPPEEVMELVDLKWKKEFEAVDVDQEIIDEKARFIKGGFHQRWEEWRRKAYKDPSD
jgi:4-hydroxy-3-polyprenylbenzoate decarboxylase